MLDDLDGCDTGGGDDKSSTCVNGVFSALVVSSGFFSGVITYKHTCILLYASALVPS